MNEKVMIKSGYQPVKLQNGYQPVARATKGGQNATASVPITIKPPRGGSAETVLKK